MKIDYFYQLLVMIQQVFPIDFNYSLKIGISTNNNYVFTELEELYIVALISFNSRI